MTKDMTQKEKVNYFIEITGIQKKKIERDLNRSNTAVKRWFKKESKISHELVNYLINKHDMSPNWFYFNIGHPKQSKNEENRPENKQGEEKVNEKNKELEIEKTIYLKERDILQRKVFVLEEKVISFEQIKQLYKKVSDTLMKKIASEVPQDICVLYDKCKVIEERD